jgi:hypothetical protein
MIRVFLSIAFTFLVLLAANGQVSEASDGVWMNYVAPAPESIFERFREAGMNPVDHPLTEVERAKVEAAFAVLPPLHRKVLSTGLHSISFMDNMPNTALTSPIVTRDSVDQFNITFRAGILHETISEWVSKKENTLYDKTGDGEYILTIEAGKLDAFVYVLLHEATHVVDAIMKMTPPVENATDSVAPTAITKGIWHKMNVPVERYIDPLVEQTIFRGGARISISRAPELYHTLSKMPFVSLYATASWSEDIAELETIYHLTQKMNQPFCVIVKKENAEPIRFESMKNKVVKSRLDHLKVFYK